MGIERVKIPDDDIPGWVQVLREGGFSNEEIDGMLSQLNIEYAKGAMADVVEEELKRVEQYLRDTHGRILTRKQREYLRENIANRPEFKDFQNTK